ncbi:MAG TPA: TRAP transporter small permease [Firmicutes bacterium]|nr:TRAP transporter small permease [Bacillota bacterium]
MRLLRELSERLEAVSASLLYLLLAVMVATTFIQVFFRYVVFHSLPWSEEVSRYALVWLTFVGASYGIKRGIHVAVEALVQALPPAARRVLKALSCVLVAFLGAVLTVYGTKLAQVNMGQLSPSLHIPIGLAYAAVPVGGLLMLIHSLALLVPAAREVER